MLKVLERFIVFGYKVRIFDEWFRTFRVQQGKNSQYYGYTGRNKHLDPIFLLQFSSVQYMAEICAKFEKNHDCTSFSFKGSYLN